MQNPRPVMPDTSAMTPQQAAKAQADFEAAHDAYVANAMSKPASALDKDEIAAIQTGISSWLKDGRP